MEKCLFCKSRKGKRNCPALAGMICSQCCGSEREKGIECPQDCFYLGKSKQYFTERQESRQLSDFEQEMKSVFGDEDSYLSLLHSIEIGICNACKRNSSITDEHLQAALEYLMEMGKARLELPAKFLTEPVYEVKYVIDAIDENLQLRDSIGEREDLLTHLKCIYRVLDSVKTHYDPQDERSYINFINPFVS
jgi:hypothetical protein